MEAQKYLDESGRRRLPYYILDKCSGRVRVNAGPIRIKRFRATQEPGLASNSARGSSGKSHSIIQGAKKLAILIVCGRIYPPEFALIAKILLIQNGNTNAFRFDL